MTRVVFETATFADVIKKADRVAPSRGNAFDKAAGIVIEIDPSSSAPVIVRATDLNIFSMEWVDYVDVEGDKTTWRVPSKLFTQVITGLPIGTGKQITLEEVTQGAHSFLQVTAGRTKAKFNLMMTDHYPEWPVFDPSGLLKASDLGGKLAQVEWAAAKTDSTPELEGIHFDGEHCIATDRYRLAMTEMKVPGFTVPVTVPAGILGSILKQTGEVSLGIQGQQLLLMPDEHTQIRAILFGREYPNVMRIAKRDHPSKVKVKKAPLLEMMNRAASFAGANRTPTLRMFIGREEIAVMMDNIEVGLLGDVIDVPGFATHPRIEVLFTPKNIIEPITYAPNEEVEICYDQDDPYKIMLINGGSGYECWVVPRKSIATET